MRFIKYQKPISELYHYTTKANAEKILSEKVFKTGKDKFCFFATSIEDSRMLFRCLMEKEVSYIDDSLSVQQRIPQNPENYVILKIKVQNDGKFYRFLCETDGLNPYDYSVMHLGTLSFRQAEVLPVRVPDSESSVIKHSKTPFFTGLKRAAVVGIMSAILCFDSFSAYAATDESWLNGHYDISWYDSSNDEFNLSTPAQVAGISYLANQGDTLSGKSFVIQNDVDLTEYQWVSIPESFLGTIDGQHKVVLSLLNDQVSFVEGKTEFGNISFRYTENSTQVKYSVNPTYTVTIPETVELGQTAEIKAEDVVVAFGSQVEVALTGTSGESNAFQLKSAEGATLGYTVKNKNTAVNVGDTVLTVNPVTASVGRTTLSFEKPESVTYAGEYTGTVTFTIAVKDVN